MISLREYELASLVIAIIIGYQLMFYFLYQYKKLKNENLELNKILLAYGLFFGFEISSFLTRLINVYYIENPLVRTIFIIFSLCLIILALMSFFLTISRNAFRHVINPTFSKIFSMILILPIVSYFFFPIESVTFVLSLLIIFGGFILILYVQIKLIKKSGTGDIIKRFSLILIGQLMFIIAIFINRDASTFLVLKPYATLFQLIGPPLLIVSLLLLFLGFYKFPAFLEFGWRTNLLKLYVIDKEKLKEIYSFDFISYNKTSSIDEQEKEKVFSKAIIGINDIFSAITDTQNKNIKKIKQENLIVILDYIDLPSTTITFALLVDKDTSSAIYFLKILKEQFQNFYKDILTDISKIKENKKEFFTSFDAVLINLLE